MSVTPSLCALVGERQQVDPQTTATRRPGQQTTAWCQTRAELMR
jgi:hypothetical protein